MGRIDLMDCTLRDGGWVNAFRFGTEMIKELPDSLYEAGIGFVELGYLDAKKGSNIECSRYSGFQALKKNGLGAQRQTGAVRMVMIDYGKYPSEDIPRVDEKCAGAIDGIRLCFHKDALKEAVKMGREILEKGYILYAQPMISTRYSDEELCRTIDLMQKELPMLSAFYIVDSFGVMDTEEICARLKLADRQLDPKIALGLHTHNNRNLSLQNAIAAYGLLTEEFHPDRVLSMDCTLVGIGKGAGNLITEEFAAFLAEKGDRRFDVEKLQQISRKWILPIREHFSWGVCPEYQLTARYRTTPTYATMLVGEYGLSLEELEQFLQKIPEDKKDSFNRAFAQEYLKTGLKRH